MKSSIRNTLGIAFVAMALLAGCEREGPAERTGEALDDAAREAGEQIEEAGEQIEDCVDGMEGNC
ncbi:MAG: hypothetical protein VR73_15470 [Gammaproteobacteria bacterium BRH_c0]|nr:MAG: hypothetical protein VR73_15470 [Gammaproteobacteria bacterium BRH_c0]